MARSASIDTRNMPVERWRIAHALSLKCWTRSAKRAAIASASRSPPEMGFNSVTDAAPQETYQYLVQRISMLRLAYLHLARTGSAFDYRAQVRPLFNGALLVGGGTGPGERRVADREPRCRRRRVRQSLSRQSRPFTTLRRRRAAQCTATRNLLYRRPPRLYRLPGPGANTMSYANLWVIHES